MHIQLLISSSYLHPKYAGYVVGFHYSHNKGKKETKMHNGNKHNTNVYVYLLTEKLGSVYDIIII